MGWKAEIRAFLDGIVARGRTKASVAELMELFGDHITLESAARKWRAGNKKRPFGTPDQMRFYTLTQYLHWLPCSFSPQGKTKTYRTLVEVHPRQCDCGALFVAEKYRKTCPGCGGQGRGRRAA